MVTSTEQNSKRKAKQKYPANLYKRGDSWTISFYYRGQRYVENIGPVSTSRAKEMVHKRKTEAAEGKLEIGQRVKDLSFNEAVEKYLEYYKGNRRPKSFERHQTSAIALKAAFSGKRLSQISSFLIEKYKLDRKTACTCSAGPAREVDSGRCGECKHLVNAKAEATINRELTMLKHLFNKSGASASSATQAE